ncbi:MAG: diadenylate cyclase CdaA [Treponema sp.]
MELINEITLFYINYLSPAIDVLLLAFLLFKGYGILVKTQALQLVKGGIWVLAIYAIAFIFNLSTILWLLNTLATGLVIGAAIIFQPELRKIFLTIGQNNWIRNSSGVNDKTIELILDAAMKLSANRRGMLLVFTRQDSLKDIIENPLHTRLNAEITSQLLTTIFNYDTDLHDGAAIIGNGKILAAACYLPLTKQQDVNKTFGTRHRAALGIAEETDAVVLIVSEESGSLSLAYDSKLHYNLSTGDITRELSYLLHSGAKSQINTKERKQKLRKESEA